MNGDKLLAGLDDKAYAAQVAKLADRDLSIDVNGGRVLDAAWAAFGERRLLYGSNWPVSNKASSYADVLGIVKPYVDRKGPEAEQWFFAEAARAAYRWAAPDA